MCSVLAESSMIPRACRGNKYLMRMMTEGVWAMAPTRLQTHTTHRKMRKASWQPGIGHFPGSDVASSLLADIQEHPLRFCEEGRQKIQKMIKIKQNESSVSVLCGLGGSENIITEGLTTRFEPSDSKKEPDRDNYISANTKLRARCEKHYLPLKL